MSVPGPPASGAEALERVLELYGRPVGRDGAPAAMHVEEFESGYVVYASFPLPEPGNGVPQPAEPGGSNYVVAKDNGEVGVVPNLPPAKAMEVFQRFYRGGDAPAD